MMRDAADNWRGSERDEPGEDSFFDTFGVWWKAVGGLPTECTNLKGVLLLLCK